MNKKLITQEEYLAEEAREEQMQREFEEWGADDFSFPWLDYVSTCNFSNPQFREQLPQVIR